MTDSETVFKILQAADCTHNYASCSLVCVYCGDDNVLLKIKPFDKLEELFMIGDIKIIATL